MLSYVRLRCVVLSVVIGCVAGSSRIQANEVQWNKDFHKATKQAAKQDKPLMVMVSAPWCGYCQQMLKTTFRDEALIEHLNECFIPVYLDADDNEKIVEQLQVEGLPTTLIVSSERKVLKRLTGYQSAEALNGQIVKLCDHTKKVQPPRAIAIKHARPVPVFDGTCLVSLREDGKIAQGAAKWSSTYKGSLLWFASPEHKRQFDARPEAYWPMADGVCLVSQRLEQMPRPGMPMLAMIYANRVWFFADQARQQEFAQNPRPYAAHAGRIASNR